MFELATQSFVQTKRKKYCVLADQKRKKIANLQIPRCTDFWTLVAAIAAMDKLSDANLTPFPMVGQKNQMGVNCKY